MQIENYLYDSSLQHSNDMMHLQNAERTKLASPSSETSTWFPIPNEREVNFNSRVRVENIHITEAYVKALFSYLDKSLVDFTGFSKPKCDGFVVALSGGLDSAVITRLLQGYSKQKGTELKTVIMGQGNPNVNVEDYKGTPAEWVDIQYAKQMCSDLKLNYDYIDIGDQYEASRKPYRKIWSRSSQLPRIRANNLYSMAEENDLISVGSTNGSEYILAAYSIGGPAGNIAPLSDLYKVEVYALARDIGVPNYIQQRKPLVSELNIADSSHYGGDRVDATIIDPIIRRLWYQKQSPEKVAKELGHGARWVRDIDEKRIRGESCRRGYIPLLINRPLKMPDRKPKLVIDRSYFI